MSSRQGKYEKHGYLIEEICQIYPDLNQELEMRMLEFRAQFPTKYRDWYYLELLPALSKLQPRQWSHSTTPESFSRRQHNGYQTHSRQDQSYSRTEHKRQAEYSSRSHSRIIQGESLDSPESDACYKKFDLPHTVCKVISNRCVLYGQGKQLSVAVYPAHVPQSQYVTNLEQLKELIPFEDKKCFYEYLQTYIDQSTHLSEKLLYQLVLLHLKLKAQTEPNDISELLLNEYKKMQGEQFLRYSVPCDSHTPENGMSRDQFMSQPQDSFSTDNLTISREQFISQDLTREDFMSRDQAAGDAHAQDEDKILHRLRKLLLNGSKHKALRWAIESQEWVSALFIASSMDKDTYLSVCALYIQSIPRSDPLRTCLQVQFGLDIDYQYSDDWGVHLAAILNNAQDVSLVARFANILGGVADTCGQHFCYISGRIPPGSSCSRNSPYVLVGAENHLLAEQVPIQSVMLTMAYDNTLPHLQYYKYEVALNYIKMGVYELGLCLLQNIASVFLNGSVSLSNENYDLVSYVYDLSLHIYNRVNSNHAVWINSLGDLLHSQPHYEVQPVSSMSPEPCVQYQQVEEPSLGYEEPEPSSYSYVPSNEIQEPLPAPAVNPVPMVSYAEPVQYQEEVTDTAPPAMPPTEKILPTEPAQSMPAFYIPSYDPSQGGDSSSQDVTQQPPGPDMSNVGSISIHSKFTFAEDKTDSNPESSSKPAGNAQQENTANKTVKPQQPEKSQSTGKEGSGSSSWLSFLKFARPKNQMILPDDDKPSIVWDESKKMWVDVNSDGKSGPSALPPPPKSSQMPSSQPQTNEAPAPMNNTAPVPLPSNPLAQNGPGPMKLNAQNGYRKGKAKYVNVLASNR